MATKKKKITIAIIIVIFVILVISGVCIALYINTDMFKSNEVLFAKYLGQNLENIKLLETTLENTSYNETLDNSFYNTNIEAEAKYTQAIGTSSESSDNGINQLKITLEGQTDKINGYNYKNLKLLKNEEQVAQIEYLQSENNYGIRFSDLFNQYLISGNSNIKEMLKSIGYEEEQLKNIPENIESKQILNEVKLTEDELNVLKEKYVGIIENNLSEENFSKKNKQSVTINGQNFETNAYILTITKEQLNNIYVNLLQAIEQDEILLSKIDILQNNINEIGIENVQINLREELIKNIDLTIQKINQNNIGADTTRIIVYESDGITIRTRIETNDYQTNIDYVKIEENTFVQILVANGENEKYKFTLNNNLNNLLIEAKDNVEMTNIELQRTEELNGNNRNRQYDIIYNIEDKKIEITLTENIEIAEENNLQSFNEENAIEIETLKEQGTINNVKESIDNEIEEVKQKIQYQDIEQMLINIGIVQNSTILNSGGISETEKNRFNSNFELLKGENLSGERVLQTIQIVKNNIDDIEIISDKELKIGIVRNGGNDEIVETLTKFFEANNRKNYNVSIEYDENGLVNQLVLTLVEEE